MVQEAIKMLPVEKRDKEQRLKMSYEEFLTWSGEDIHAEWIGGEVIVFMPPKTIHQTTVGFLHNLIALFVNLFDLGVVLVAPFEMKAKPQGASREPDILFISNENLERLTEDRLVGPADLIVEVVSEDSVRRDRHNKFREYQDAGVREYWIIDPRPNKGRADFFRLDEAGEYELYATEDDEQVSSYVLTDFWLRPAWLWQADTLNPLTCGLEIEGVAAALTEQIEQAQTRDSG